MGARGRCAAIVVAVLALLLPVMPGPAVDVARADVDTTVDTRAPRTAVCSADVVEDCTRRLDFHAGRLPRSAYLYVPPAGPTVPVPMVVVVHGYRMTPRSMDDMAQWTALARREGFAVTFPQGYGDPPATPGYQAGWNAGRCCGPAAWGGVDDLAMMDATVRAARTAYRSDGRVYFAGFSNGAMLAYRLQCADRGPFRAFVAVNGTMTVPSCAPRGPRPFLAVNALQDIVVPYQGCSVRQATSSCARTLHTDLMSVPVAVSTLRRASGCTLVSTRAYAPHVLRSTASGCRLPGAVHMTVDNAGHGWATDRTRYGINETEEAWRFLRTAVPYLGGR